MKNIGGLLSRIIRIDPEIDQWVKKINDQYDLDKNNERECLRKNRDGVAPHTGVAHGDTGVGMQEQIGKVDIMEINSPPRVMVQASKFGLRAGEAMHLGT